jgi:hypothetical protein
VIDPLDGLDESIDRLSKPFFGGAFLKGIVR